MARRRLRRAAEAYSPECVEGNSPKFACGLLDKVAWVRAGLITFNTNLSRFSARSHTALLVILVIRTQLATEGSNVDAGTE
jgi:hypothetical protein